MISVRLFLQLVFAISCAFAIPTQFENTKVIRTIEVKDAIAREDVGIRAKNMDSTPSSEYFFYVPIVISNTTASITAFLRKQKTELPVRFVEIDVAKQVYVYKVELNTPVEPDHDVVLGLKLAYTHTIKPMPAQLPQVARQHTIFAFNSYFLSPYQNIEDKTTLYVPSKNIVSQTGAGGKSVVTGNKIVYGPYSNVQPRSFELATAHFENLKPLITITDLRRDIEVSHWGKNLAVEEHYALRNDGASLNTEFSRVHYQMTTHIHDQTNVLKGLSFDLPVGARDPYFRDEVGNVSTSHFRVEQEKAVLELTPRYPLFGGWTYTWYHGFNADLAAFLHKAKSGKYALKFNFVENVKEMTIDKAVVRVVLPEGVSNVKVHTPFDVDSQEITHYFTYFDSTGRTMVILEKANVLKEHELPILIEYDYSFLRLLQKPIVASGAIFTFFILSILLNQMSWTIDHAPKSSKKKTQ